MSESKFHTHTKQLAELWFCVFTYTILDLLSKDTHYNLSRFFYLTDYFLIITNCSDAVISETLILEALNAH
jgi:hypothetical protein